MSNILNGIQKVSLNETVKIVKPRITESTKPVVKLNPLEQFQKLLEGISQEDLADVLCHRLEMRYPDIYSKYDYDTVYRAVDDVASFHAGAEELGSSDIGIMLRSVIKRLEEQQGVDEGWKEKVAGAAIGAAALGGIGAGIANSPMAYVKGQQIHMAMPGKIPDNAKLVTDDNGKKIYVWQPEELRTRGMKGQPQWVYRPADTQVKEQGVEEGFSDVVKGIKRSIKGKEHPDVVASKHAGRAMGHYNQGDIAAGDKETKRYVKTRDMHLKAKGVAEGSDQKLVNRQVSYWDQVAKEKKNKEREASTAKKAEYEKTPAGKAEKYWSQKGVAEEQLNELSTEKLAQYKKAAGEDAKKADKEGDYDRGNKRFSGIVKATKKQFDNETKPKKESTIMKGIVDETLGTPYPGTYEQENKPFQRKGPQRTMKLTTEGK